MTAMNTVNGCRAGQRRCDVVAFANVVVAVVQFHVSFF